MHILIALDPGLTLGVAIFHDGALLDAHAIPQGQHYSYLSYKFYHLARVHQATVVCEDFIGRYLTVEAKATLKLIGQIEWATMEATGTMPVYQRAQARLSFLPQAKTLVRQLPEQQKWLQHHYDATAHGLHWLYKQGAGHDAKSSALREA